MKNFNEIIYKRLDFDEVQKEINEVAAKIRTATSEDDFFKYIKNANELTEEVNSMVDYTYVQSLHDSNDKDAYEQMSYTISGAEMMDTNEITQAMLDSPYKKAFDEKYGDFYLKEKFLPLVLQVNTRLKERLGVEEYTANESGLNFSDGAAKLVEDVKKLKELAQKMYDDLDPYIGDFFRTMNEYG